MKEKYRLEVESIGKMAKELFSDGVVIFFGNNAPGELHEVSVIHTHGKLEEDIEGGDMIEIDEVNYRILCCGPVVNENLRNLGHMVLKFNGSTEIENLGDVNMERVEVPNFKVGTKLFVKRGE